MTVLRRKPLYESGSNGQPYEPIRPGDDQVSGLDVVMFLAVSPFLIGWWLLKHWPSTLTAALGLVLGSVFGPVGAAAASVGIIAAGIVWRHLHPVSFDWAVAAPYRRRRRRRTYRRAWTATMHNAGLTRGFGSERVAPRIVKTHLGEYTDRLLVQMLVGQGVDELHATMPALSDTFGALAATVIPEPAGGGKAGRVWVTFTIRDRLTTTVPPIAPTDPVDLDRLTVGFRDDATPWNISLAGGKHLLIGGATGAGKSSVLWSIMNALGPSIRSGLVQVWACDPKGGMELAIGADLFTRFSYGAESGDMVAMVTDTETLIEHRASIYRGNVRTHVATVDDPHIVLVLDELSALTAYSGDKEFTRTLNRALPHVLSQGRAVGVTVVGALQDPRKQTVDFRGLFPTRIGLRTNEADDVGMILTDGAHARGARCEHIDPATPGVGYVETPGDSIPVRVRSSYFDDNAVRDLAAKYRPLPGSVPGAGPVILGEVLTPAAAGGGVSV